MGFTVTTIAREPWPILNRFLSWHLDQGAERIILFLDDPDDPSLPRLQGEPRIDVRLCTPAFWASMNLSPTARFTRRQRHVLARAYADTPDGWLLVLDADELMWMRGRTIPDALVTLPIEAQSLRVRSAEKIILPDGSEGFRGPIARASVDQIYGDDARLLRARFGLTYHPEGKSFHRAGQQNISMKMHWAKNAAGDRTPGPTWGAREDAYLLHYAAPDYDSWRAKVAWRAGSHGFSQPTKDRLAAIAKSDDPDAGYRAFYDTLHALTQAQADALDKKGALLRESPPLQAV